MFLQNPIIEDESKICRKKSLSEYNTITELIRQVLVEIMQKKRELTIIILRKHFSRLSKKKKKLISPSLDYNVINKLKNMKSTTIIKNTYKVFYLINYSLINSI